MNSELTELLDANDDRLRDIASPFNPVTGRGSVGPRFLLRLPDFALRRQFLPLSMQSVPLVQRLVAAGSLEALLNEIYAEKGFSDVPREQREADRLKLVDSFIRLRHRHDFPFWAATQVWIKNKGGGEDVLFRLSRPQRRFVRRLEELRLQGRPIRIILLKARQWGGSTTSQLYMAWLQLVHKVGLNSLIIAHQTSGSDEIRDMFSRMLQRYPLRLLHKPGETFSPSEPKLIGVGMSGLIHAVPQRNCKIKIGTAKNPDSCRGGDYNLVHCSEVGIWETTEKKTPEDIVRSACAGVLLRPYTMIVYESTANGTGNFFQREYEAARRGESQFEPMFVSWFDIEQYSLPFESQAEKEEFARSLIAGRHAKDAPSERAEPGSYLWWLWEKGATLEAIHWYVLERAKASSHGVMASEYPSDDIEAFVHSGARVFDRYHVEALRPACKAPIAVGEVDTSLAPSQPSSHPHTLTPSQPSSLTPSSVKFFPDAQGRLEIWAFPEIDPDEPVADRYLAVVDVGGRSNKADWSVIVVFDRLFMAEGGRPSVVAQWYGHTDADLLAWNAARIAAFYDNALLVIESNTLETHDAFRDVDGDQSRFILNQIKDAYPRLYARRQSEEAVIEGQPLRYGFHTNTATKPMVISSLIRIVREGLYIERDQRCLDEFLAYEKRPNGSFGAIPGRHDDLLMTRAIGLHICFNEMPLPRVLPPRRQGGSLPPSRPKPPSEAAF